MQPYNERIRIHLRAAGINLLILILRRGECQWRLTYEQVSLSLALTKAHRRVVGGAWQFGVNTITFETMDRISYRNTTELLMMIND